MSKYFNLISISFWTIVLLLLSNLITIIVILTGYNMNLSYPPIFILEFCIILLFFYFKPNAKLFHITYFLFSTFNFIVIIGKLFLGNFLFLFSSLKYITFIPLQWYHIFIPIYIYITSKLASKIYIEKILTTQTKKRCFILITILILLQILDYYNSSIFMKDKQLSIINLNISGLHSKEIFHYYKATKKNNLSINSKSYKIIKEDTISKNILLIILESFPYYNDNKNNHILYNLISTNLKNKYYITYDSIPFYGTTVTAEINELTNTNNGFFNYMDSCYPLALGNIKKNQGYQTFAAHSFTISMFGRKKMWHNLGFNYIYGKDEIPHLPNDINSENPFLGLNDEVTFDFLISKSKDLPQKTFTYLLTVNTHFPFKLNDKEKLNKYKSILKNLDKSKNLQMSFIRFHEQLDHITKRIEIEKIDLVIIRGDHKPPFLNEEEAKMINFRQVPEIIIRRKH
jgi:hypothetical protein